MLGAEKYDLTDEEFQRCLSMAEMAIFIQGISYKNPKSIFVIAQPGAGKTGLKVYSLNQNQTGVFVELNPDEVAVYHKYYNQIINEYPNEQHAQLQKFVLPALDDYLRQKAVLLRNNILQEGTFGSTEGYMKILEFQKNGGIANIGRVKEDNTRETVNVEGGYEIEINVLAVHRFESLLSSYEREQYLLDSGLLPRAVTPENHDRSYYNMLETLKKVEERKLFDKIRIFKRGKSEVEPELVYLTGNENSSEICAVVERIREENKKEIIKDSDKFLDRINKLKKQNISKSLFERLEMLEKEFSREIEQQDER